MNRLDYIVQPGGSLHGVVRVPGDKSISHRAVMLAALAEGTTVVDGLLEGEDVLRTVAAFRQMGVSIRGPTGGRIEVDGVGLHGLTAPVTSLDMGNSGTAMRLMAGILAAQPFDAELVGDPSLPRRPMRRVVDPLREMGANIEAADNGCPPLHIRGGRRLKGIRYSLPVASAQVKSSILLAGLYADGQTEVTQPAPTRDHTERMLRAFGYVVEGDDVSASLHGGGRLRATKLHVPADISSAAFFLVGASMAAGSELRLPDVGVNPTRIGALTILHLMGADIDVIDPRTIGGEPVADLRVRGRRLHGVKIPPDQVPLAIDELPAIMVAAAYADGETHLSEATELRVKESDRIAAVAAGLKAVGIQARETPDGMVVHGGRVRGGTVDSHGDHRIAMAFAMAGLAATDSMVIRDCKNVDTSFPGFVGLARAAGLRIETATAGG